ncbi:uncharacterized protein [Typha angustifolia]|uniref:uncharacterized protein n=1 Tax=Typha angustifolia TaxID=59011 RepID=UPI003C2AB010
MGKEMIFNVLAIWRGKQLNVEINNSCNVKELGQKLQEMTNVKPETMRLLVPQSTNKSSKMITPFSDVHSNLSLQEAGILEGKLIRMMGVFVDEIEEVSQTSSKSDLRIPGFDEEEKRLKQRMLSRPQSSLRLPHGTYIFCDFRTLHIPGIELNPPSSEALKRMHMLACDPGIIAIMNKHRWRVGIMTEMAPVGYVGISPKCVLGFNKNQGEEISLRLRTDDLKGFRKYESIKKTLLHELAHMVYSEHDANFFALNNQLNEEAFTLDWTKSRSHTLNGRKNFDTYEELFLEESSGTSGQKLGGVSEPLASARASSVAAAYQRSLDASTSLEGSQGKAYSDVDEAHMHAAVEPDGIDLNVFHGKEYTTPDPDTGIRENDAMNLDVVAVNRKPSYKSAIPEEHDEPDPDDFLEPDPDDFLEPNPDDFLERDPDNSGASDAMLASDEPDPDDSGAIDAMLAASDEPDPDDSLVGKSNEIKVEANSRNVLEPDPDDSMTMVVIKEVPGMHDRKCSVPDLDECIPAVQESGNVVEGREEGNVLKAEPDPDDRLDGVDNQELQRIEEPVVAICTRLQKAIQMLRSELTPGEATAVFQTIFKIIRNVIEHPNEEKFRRLRKANPQFQRNVANHEAAMEILKMVGFCEYVISDEIGRAETYMLLKRNDPALLWLAKSSLELSIA